MGANTHFGRKNDDRQKGGGIRCYGGIYAGQVADYADHFDVSPEAFIAAVREAVDEPLTEVAHQDPTLHHIGLVRADMRRVATHIG
jgi:hypothetical protein